MCLSLYGVSGRDVIVNAWESGRVPGMIPGRALNGVSGREEVIKLFIVTDGAECVMPSRLSAHLEEPAVFRTKPHPSHCLRALSMTKWTRLQWLLTVDKKHKENDLKIYLIFRPFFEKLPIKWSIWFGTAAQKFGSHFGSNDYHNNDLSSVEKKPQLNSDISMLWCILH